MITEQEHKSFNVLFEHIFNGNAAAKSLAFTLLNFFHIWDDIKDKEFNKLDSNVDKVFFDLLTSVASNPYWDLTMQGCFMSVYYRWQAANAIEKDIKRTKDDLAKAWMLRAGCYDLFVLIAAKIYGRQWGEEIAPIVYRFYGEKLEDFINEVGHA